MSGRADPGLRRVLEDLGTTVLQVASLPGDADPVVTGVAIYDPLDELTVPPGGVLLGVGIGDDESICGLLGALG